MMQPLRLDYQRSVSSFGMAGLAILLASIALGIWLGNDYLRFVSEKENLEASLSKLQRIHRKSPANSRAIAKENEATKPELKRAGEVIQQLSLPWNTLFKAVEDASFNDAALLGIQPDVPKQLVSINAEAKDLASMLEYVNRLSIQPMLTDIHIINHQIQQQEPEKPVRFTVLATWTM